MKKVGTYDLIAVFDTVLPSVPRTGKTLRD